MLDDLSKSIKASLYERATSPLFGAFVISWLAWNYRFVLTVISSMSAKEKFSYRVLSEKDDEVKQLNSIINKSKEESSGNNYGKPRKVIPKKVAPNKSFSNSNIGSDEIKIIRIIVNNRGSATHPLVLNSIDLPELEVEYLIEKLVKFDLIKEVPPGYYDLTMKGKKLAIDMGIV